MYVTLYKLTDQGRKTIRDSPKRAREVVAKIDKMPGHKVHHVLYTTGRYDMVVVSEAPNDQAANAVALETMAAGNVVGETLHAFTLDDIDKVVSKLS